MKHRLTLPCLTLLIACASLPHTSAAATLAPAPSLFQNSAMMLVSTESVSAPAEKFITGLANQGIGFLSDEKISTDAQRAEFRKLLNRKFDLTTIARFSLGTHWRGASKAQKDEYIRLFKNMIVDVYSQRFSDYQGQTLTVTGSRKEGKRDILVHSLLEQDSGPDVKIDWRVRNRDGQFKVIDVIVEGVSMALTQRSDFASVVQRGGGDVEALLAHMRED